MPFNANTTNKYLINVMYEKHLIGNRMLEYLKAYLPTDTEKFTVQTMDDRRKIINICTKNANNLHFEINTYLDRWTKCLSPDKQNEWHDYYHQINPCDKLYHLLEYGWDNSFVTHYAQIYNDLDGYFWGKPIRSIELSRYLIKGMAYENKLATLAGLPIDSLKIGPDA